ncbi:MAG TPA: hypothetical protein VIY48_14180 [Candidatus Paceibacterota bacterium]
MREMSSNDPLYMFAQELVGSWLIMKEWPTRDDDTPHTLHEEYVTGEYAALIRATGYACGAGKLYGGSEWRDVCDGIRECVKDVCVGFSHSHITHVEYRDLVCAVTDYLTSVAILCS